MDFERRICMDFLTGYIQRSSFDDHVQSLMTVTHTELDDFTACSPVLDAWVRWNPELKRPGNITLISFSNDEKAVKVLTDYMQGHEVKITEDVLPEVLSLADMLQVDEITNYCTHLILNKSLNIENCLQILKLCSLYNIEHPRIDEFIRGNLTELSQMEDMLCITRDSLDILLTDEELSYWPMDDRFVFISAWCNAQEDRLVYFETLFKQLDLYKIDRDIIEVVIKKDILVSRSKLCLDLINMHLCDRKDKPVPFVFVLNVRSLGSNVFGFNLEDKRLYQFKFPDQIVDSSVLTVAESGHILSIKQTPGKTYFYDYDVNSNNCIEKTLKSCENLSDISHILDAHGKLILITNQSSGLFYHQNHGSDLYQQVSADEKSIRIEPVLTLTFDVARACFSQSMIIMASTTFAERTKMFFFYLETNKFIEMEFKISHIIFIIPFKTKLLLASRHTSCIVDLDKLSTEFIIKKEEHIILQSFSRYTYFSQSIIRVANNLIQVWNLENEEDFMQDPQSSFYLERLKIDYKNKVANGYLDETKTLCHIMCPHCDPNVREKEEQRILQQRFLELWPDSDDDNGNEPYYGWNRPELIWDGSADEFVEAWW